MVHMHQVFIGAPGFFQLKGLLKPPLSISPRHSRPRCCGPEQAQLASTGNLASANSGLTVSTAVLTEVGACEHMSQLNK